MTLTPGELQRKVRQLDNDMQATYSMLADISATQKRMGTRLDALDEKVDNLDTKLSGKIDAVDAKLSGKVDEVIQLVRALG